MWVLHVPICVHLCLTEVGTCWSSATRCSWRGHAVVHGSGSSSRIVTTTHSPCINPCPQERNPGGPGRVSRGELESLLGPGRGWSLTSLAPHRMELHPTFWGGRAQAYLAAAQKAA